MKIELVVNLDHGERIQTPLNIVRCALCGKYYHQTDMLLGEFLDKLSMTGWLALLNLWYCSNCKPKENEK